MYIEFLNAFVMSGIVCSSLLISTCIELALNEVTLLGLTKHPIPESWLSESQHEYWPIKQQDRL